MPETEDYLTNKSVMYLTNLLDFQKTKEIENKDIYLLKVTDICYEEQAPKKEALENVLSSLKMDGLNFIFLIVGRKEKVDFYYGISKDLNYKKPLDFAIKDIGDTILRPAIQGNFRGSKTKALTADERESVLETIRNMPEAGVIEGVPGANKDDEKYQGIDRLINVMYGDSYCFLVVAKPLNMEDIFEIQKNLYEFYDMKSSYSKKSIQIGKGTNSGSSESNTEGTSNTEGSSGSATISDGTSNSDTHTVGTNDGWNEGWSKNDTKDGQTNHSSATGSSGSKSGGSNTSDAKQTGANHSESKTIGNSSSKTKNESKTTAKSTGSSTSTTTTVEYSNRNLQDFIKFMDDVIFPRLDYGKGKGMFLTSMCVFASKKTALQKIKNTVTALYSGETGNKIPLSSFDLSENAKNAFRSFQLPTGKYKDDGTRENYLTHFAMHHIVDRKKNTCLGNWITTNELGMIAGLPQKEVVGLSLNEEVEFGLNYQKPDLEEHRIELGCLIQNGNELKESPVYLDKADLDKHIFVSGVTGSGKTTTCQKILKKADMPFLVIEPAKTEYRVMCRNDKDIKVFTLGDNQTTPLPMNPLIFYPRESITSRVDLLCACIESAFDMEAAIPQIIEQALYRSYEEKGWDIYTNQNRNYSEEECFDGSGKAFPTISDLIKNCEIVVNEQGFDDRLKNDYIGSIKARLLGLTSGEKGFLLNTTSSVDFMDLLDHKVVFELEHIRSSAEKSLIMGFILINLSEAIREKYELEGKFQHITLVEEAHRLLSKCQAGDSPAKKQSVEMFSDMLAEIRKYGESLIIVDQIPNKLTPDVLKNTNTKIIHRIFAADDKEAVGNTIMLKEEQKEFLSNLPTGRAVYFTTGTDKAIQIQIDRETDTSEQTPTNDDILASCIDYYKANYKRGIYRGLEIFSDEPNNAQFACIREMNRKLTGKWLKEFTASNGKSISVESEKEMEEIIQTIGRNEFINYLRLHSVRELQIFLSGKCR
ncbi:MAG: helicase HerA domain-containing protein [Lachnospiraceae bacterium]